MEVMPDAPLTGLLYRVGLMAAYRAGLLTAVLTRASGYAERAGLTERRGLSGVYCEIVRSERRYGRRVADMDRRSVDAVAYE